MRGMIVLVISWLAISYQFSTNLVAATEKIIETFQIQRQ